MEEDERQENGNRFREDFTVRQTHKSRHTWLVKEGESESRRHRGIAGNLGHKRIGAHHV